jgi:hypothetical protein
MISEKTVELNVTAELLNWLRSVTGVTHTAIGPSLAQEGIGGYDVSFHGSATSAALVQFKRAYVTGQIWTWHLNRTAHKDQHARLQFLESKGYPVFYAFPHFATAAQLVAGRRGFVTSTFWYPPSYIQPAGGSLGHHNVTYNEATGAWQVNSSNIVNLPPPLRIRDVIHAMEDPKSQGKSIDEFAVILNRVMLAADDSFSQAGREPDAESNVAGQSLLVRNG